MCFVNFSGLETLQQNRRHSMFFQTVNLGEMVMCLEDLINYFAQPEDDMGNIGWKSFQKWKIKFRFVFFFRTRGETKSIPCVA